MPSSGIHSNGLTLARRVLDDLDERPPELGGRSVGEELLEPTAIYVRAVKELLASEIEVRGLAHITGDGLSNLLRLEADVGYRIDSPLPVPPIFELIADRGGIEPDEMHEVFNMGCGFCVVVPPAERERAVELLSRYHPGAAPIGEATSGGGQVELPDGRAEGSASTAPVGADDLTIVRWLYESFGDDARGALELYDPEIVWEPQGLGIHMVGTDERYEGFAGIRRWWGHYLDAWEDLTFVLEDLQAGEAGVLAHVRMMLEGKESGMSIDQRHYAVWRLRDGKVVHMKVFQLPEREQALQAAGLIAGQESAEQETNLRIIRGFYDAFARRDHESAFKHYSPDVEWDVSRFPTPGIDPVYRGHEGIRRFWRAWLGAWAELAFEVKEIRAAGPYVAVRIEQRNLGRESGIWVDQGTWTSLWTLRDGLVIRQEFFDDHDEALRAAGIEP